MPFTVIAVMMSAATLSATFNALIKGADEKLFMTILLTTATGVVSALALAFLPGPGPASWPFIAVSATLSVGYYAVVAEAYQVADLSQAFPVMRGTAPLLVALASRALIGEHLSWPAWLGVGLICSGILGLATSARSGSAKGVGLALVNAVLIACYTCCDGIGVRRSGSPFAYGLWVNVLTALPLLSWILLARGRAFVRYLPARLHLGLLGGLASATVYSATLWGMTVAPVALVAALRETSILSALAISAVFLKEKVGLRRALLACAIAGGAMALRLA